MLQTVMIRRVAFLLFVLLLGLTLSPRVRSDARVAIRLAIIEGTFAKEGEFPWQVFIEIDDTLRDRNLPCGGSIIDERWVLTAAHCVCFKGARPCNKGVRPTIYFGSIDRTKGEKLEVDLEKIVVHEKYDTDWPGGPHDIALLPLKNSIPDAPIIELADLKIEKELNLQSSPKLYVSGWGAVWDFSVTDSLRALSKKNSELEEELSTLKAAYKRLEGSLKQSGNAVAASEAAKQIATLLDKPRSLPRLQSPSFDRQEFEKPHDLQYVDLRFIERKTCNTSRLQQLFPEADFKDEATRAAAKKLYLKDNVICAKGWTPGKDACRGDSGGALVAPKKSGDTNFQDPGAFIQVGVVGGGFQCGNPLTPGVYARVASFHDWIKEKIQPSGTK